MSTNVGVCSRFNQNVVDNNRRSNSVDRCILAAATWLDQRRRRQGVTQQAAGLGENLATRTTNGKRKIDWCAVCHSVNLARAPIDSPTFHLLTDDNCYILWFKVWPLGGIQWPSIVVDSRAFFCRPSTGSCPIHCGRPLKRSRSGSGRKRIRPEAKVAPPFWEILAIEKVAKVTSGRRLVWCRAGRICDWAGPRPPQWPSCWISCRRIAAWRPNHRPARWSALGNWCPPAKVIRSKWMNISLAGDLFEAGPQVRRLSYSRYLKRQM